MSPHGGRTVRVLLSPEAGTRPGDVLDLGVELAARLDAEFEGLLVEASNLLRAVSHPSALHVSYPGGTAVDLADVAAAVRHAADRVRADLERAAERARLRWSFRVVGEQVAAEAAPGREGDVLVLDRTVAWAFRTPAAPATASGSPLLPAPFPPLQAHREGFAGRLWVLWDGSRAACGALDVAARLSTRKADGPRLLVAAGSLLDAERLAALAPPSPRRGGVAWRWAGGARAGDVARALPLDAILVTSAASPAAGGASGVERLLREAPGPVLIVG